MHILIIEDNPDILANLYGFLEPLGYTLDSARDGVSGLQRAVEHTYDAILLDLMLPKMDGITLCKRLRADYRCTTPVLMLTARDTVDDKIIGLGSGADDYVVKPFSLMELDARIKALVRRARGIHVEGLLTLGDLHMDTTTRVVTRAGRPIDLTPIGYTLLKCLMRNAPALVKRETLEWEIWGDSPPDSDALRAHIHALRAAIDKPFDKPMLITIPRVGYRLVNPDAP